MCDKNHHHRPNALTMLIHCRRKCLFDFWSRRQCEGRAVDQNLMTFSRHLGLSNDRHTNSIKQFNYCFECEPFSGLIIRTVTHRKQRVADAFIVGNETWQVFDHFFDRCCLRDATSESLQDKKPESNSSGVYRVGAVGLQACDIRRLEKFPQSQNRKINLWRKLRSLGAFERNNGCGSEDGRRRSLALLSQVRQH